MDCSVPHNILDVDSLRAVMYRSVEGFLKFFKSNILACHLSPPHQPSYVDFFIRVGKLSTEKVWWGGVLSDFSLTNWGFCWVFKVVPPELPSTALPSPLQGCAEQWAFREEPPQNSCVCFGKEHVGHSTEDTGWLLLKLSPLGHPSKAMSSGLV